VDGAGGVDIVTATSILAIDAGTYAKAVAYNPVRGDGVALGDLDSDGRLDIVAAEWTRRPTYRGGAMRVFLRRGSARLCNVPRVVGRIPRIARRLLRSSGCSLGAAEFLTSASHTGQDRVVVQSLKPGTRAIFRTPVALVIEHRRIP
jgi:hypothetical protein